MYHFIFYTLSCPEHTTLLKQFSIADFTIVAKDGLFWLKIVTSQQLIYDVTRTGDTGIVTSYSSIVPARANWHKGDLHQWKTAVNIDFSPPGIHGLACKKTYFRPVDDLIDKQVLSFIRNDYYYLYYVNVEKW